MQMKQWWVVPASDGGVLEFRDVDVPVPGAGEVLVKVAAAGVNRGEIIARSATKTGSRMGVARPSGIEFAGEVVASAEDIEGVAIGDRVMGRGRACHAEFTIADTRALMPIPAHLGFAEAACVPNVFVTAHDALASAANVCAADRVLITAGSSGVGTAAIQLANFLGAAHVAVTTRSAEKIALLQTLGATAVIHVTDDNWADNVSESFDVVIDMVGGRMFPQLLNAMTVSGRYVSVGRNDGPTSDIDLDLLARKRLQLIGVTFRTRTQDEALACTTRFWDTCLAAVQAGELKPVLDRVFPLSKLGDAHDYMLSDGQAGKIVLAT
jgi:NADPH:quinone reductase